MRISSSYRYDSMGSQISTSYAKVYSAQQQIITGKRFQKGSEDPIGSAQVVSMTSVMNRVKQLDTNLKTAKEYVSLTETSLGEVGTLLNKARTLAIQGGNAGLDAEARTALSSEVKSIQDRLVSLGNTQNSQKQFIFAGQNSGSKPFTVDPTGNLTYAGDSNPILVEVRPGETMKSDMDNPGQFFKDTFAALEHLKNSLISGNTNELSNTDLKAIQKATEQVNMARGDAGVKLQTIEKQTELNQTRIDDLTKRISDVQDVDMAEAVTAYQQADNAYRAALQTFSMAQTTNLMDYLK